MAFNTPLRDVTQDVADEQGWTDETLLDLTLEYIENQQQNDAFIDFLREHQQAENEIGRS